MGPWTPERARRAQVALLLVLTAAMLVTSLLDYLGPEGDATFWDLEVYAAATQAFREGESPYLHPFRVGDGVSLRFVYPPLVLRLLGGLGDLVVPTLVAFDAAAVAAFLAAPLPGLPSAFLLANGLVQPGPRPVEKAIVAGNLGVFLHLLILGLWFSRRPSWRTTGFTVAVVLASLLKPYYALYLLLDLLAGRVSLRTAAARASVGLATVGVLWGLQLGLDRELFLQFLDSLRLATLGVGKPPHEGDVGFGLSRVLALATGSATAATALHGAAWAFAITLWVRRLGPTLAGAYPETPEVRTHLAVLLVLLTNPRLKVYDSAVSDILLAHLLLRLGARPSTGRSSWVHPLTALILLRLAIHLVKKAALPGDLWWLGVSASIHLPILALVAVLLAGAPKEPRRSPETAPLLPVPDPTEASRVGLFAAQGIGDGVILLPLAQALRARGHDVTLHADPLQALAPLVPEVNIRPWPAASKLEEALDAFDLAFAMDYTSISARPALPVSVQVFRERGLDRRRTMVENYRRLSEERLGVPWEDLRPRFEVPEEWQFRGHSRRVALHPQSSVPEKDWSAVRFTELAGLLEARGFAPVFVLAPEQQTAWRARGVRVAETRSLLEAARVLHESGAFIGVDSGLGHLASAFGVPTVTIMKSRERADLWRPGWGGEVVTPLVHLPWPPLRNAAWPYLVSAERVVAALEDLVREAPSPEGISPASTMAAKAGSSSRSSS